MQDPVTVKFTGVSDAFETNRTALIKAALADALIESRKALHFSHLTPPPKTHREALRTAGHCFGWLRTTLPTTDTRRHFKCVQRGEAELIDTAKAFAEPKATRVA